MVLKIFQSACFGFRLPFFLFPIFRLPENFLSIKVFYKEKTAAGIAAALSVHLLLGHFFGKIQPSFHYGIWIQRNGFNPFFG